MSERHAQLLLLGALILLPVVFGAEPLKDPIYVKTSNGWNAAYAHGNEYAEFRVVGKRCKTSRPLSHSATKECWDNGFPCRSKGASKR
jgi:hypothetical protein